MGDDWEDNSASLSMGDSSKKKAQKVSLVQEMKARRGDQVRQCHSQKFIFNDLEFSLVLFYRAAPQIRARKNFVRLLFWFCLFVKTLIVSSISAIQENMSSLSVQVGDLSLSDVSEMELSDEDDKKKQTTPEVAVSTDNNNKPKHPPLSARSQSAKVRTKIPVVIIRAVVVSLIEGLIF